MLERSRIVKNYFGVRDNIFHFLHPIDITKPSPYSLPPKPKWIPGEKAMTLIGGFRCTDGVVLCADTEMTIPGWLKYPGSKLQLFNRPKCSPAFAFAGDAQFCKMFIQKLVARISLAERTGKDIYEAIEEESWKIHEKFRDEAYERESSLIASMFNASAHERNLLDIYGGKVAWVSQSCQGTGTASTRALVTELFSDSLTMSQTALLAVYLLAEGKAYGDGVGKDSQILMLSDEGWYSPFPISASERNLQEIENDYIRLKQLLKPVILAYSNYEIGNQDFSKILETFKVQAQSHREKQLGLYADLLKQEWDRQMEEDKQLIEEDEESES